MGTTFEQTGQLVTRKHQSRVQVAFPMTQVQENDLGRKLWPEEQYRSDNQLASAQVIRKLWSWNMNQVFAPLAEPQLVRRLWPSDEYRLASQGEEDQIVRHLWQ